MSVAVRRNPSVVLLFAAFTLSLFLTACGDNATSGGPPIVDPIFSSTPPPAAQEGATWSYTVAATNPSGGSVTYALTTSPSGASLSGATVTWTPTHAESRTDNNFVISATTSEGGSAKQSFTITPNGTINATVIDHAVTGRGLVPVPLDLSRSTIEALVPVSSGGFTTIAGTGDANGNITIPNVPAGSYWLNIPLLVARNAVSLTRSQYLWISASDLDLGSLTQGRPTTVLLTLPVTINPNVNLTVSPVIGDLMQWLSPDAGPTISASAPVTSSPFTTPMTQRSLGAIDSSQGDRAFLAHYTGGPALGSSSPFAMVEFLEDDSVIETSGGTVSVTGTMSPITPISAHPVIDFSQFDAVLPSGLTSSFTVKEFVITDPMYSGAEGVAGGITVFQQPFAFTATDTDLGEISFGLLGSGDSPAFLLIDEALAEYTVNGVHILTTFGTTLGTATIPTASKPLVPIISAPTSITIDGKDFAPNQTGISAAPAISWTAPTTGTADYYRVTILDFGPAATSGINLQIWEFLTTQTSLSIPPGLIQAGDQFSVALAANSTPGSSFVTAPFRRTGEFSAVMGGSGLMTVAGSSAASSRKGHPLPKGRTVFLRFGEDGRWTTEPR
jgi:hypothetical protein